MCLFWFLRYAASSNFCCFTVWSWSWWSISTSVSERARLPNTCYWQGNKNIDCADGCFYWPACKYRLRSLFQFLLSTTLSLPVWGTVIPCVNHFHSNVVPRVLGTGLVLCVSNSLLSCDTFLWKIHTLELMGRGVLLAMLAFLPSFLPWYLLFWPKIRGGGKPPGCSPWSTTALVISFQACGKVTNIACNYSLNSLTCTGNI